MNDIKTSEFFSMEIRRHQTLSRAKRYIFKLKKNTGVLEDTRLFTILFDPDIFKEMYFYIHGYQTCSPCGFIKNGDEDFKTHVGNLKFNNLVSFTKRTPPILPPSYTSTDVIVIAGRHEATLIGVEHIKTHITEFHVHRDIHTIECRVNFDGISVASPACCVSPIIVIQGDNPWGLLETYADVLAKSHGVSLHTQSITAWCSWYHFFRNVNTQQILSNARIIKQRHLPVDVMLIDDGPFIWGDYCSANRDRFPQGMERLARDLKELGLRPGIWFAPFLADTNSEIFDKHPEWFLRNESGEYLEFPMGDTRHHIIDPTISDVSRHLQDLIAFYKKIGYDYFKFDFLSAIFGAYKFSDTDATRVSAYCQGLKTLYEAAQGAFVCACNVHMLASLGLCDSVRIGMDTGLIPWDKDFPLGPSAKQMAMACFNRKWMHKRCFLNDPDVIMFKDMDKRFTPEQKDSVLRLFAIFGDVCMLSDDLTQLNRKEWDDLLAFFELRSSREDIILKRKELGILPSEWEEVKSGKGFTVNWDTGLVSKV